MTIEMQAKGLSPLESEELATKLARIWAPGRTVDWFTGSDTTDDSSFAFRAMLSDEVCFTCRNSNSSFSGLLFRLSPKPLEATEFCELHHLCCHSESSKIRVIRGESPYADSRAFEQFLGEWHEMFRRNSWLSGCPIECSVHEQLEWTLWLQEQEAR